MRWFIADTHFGHHNVIEYDKRPFKDVDHMNDQMIERWNSVISATDTVYHLGDSAFLPVDIQSNILSRLNGRKVLIRGNHDKSENTCYRIGWDFVCEGLLINLKGFSFTCVHNPDSCNLGGFILHGHTHKSNPNPYRLCVSCNLWDHTPISEKVLEKEIKKKVKEQNNWGIPLTP